MRLHTTVPVSALLSGYDVSGVRTFFALEPITSIADRASDCTQGSMFVAIKGANGDGHDFIGEAIAAGAIIIVGDKENNKLKLSSVPYVPVENARIALADLAARAAEFPSRKLLSFAVTGTNGKTTTHCIVASVLNSLGQRCLRTGTLGAYLEDICFSPDTLTTPGALELTALLARAVESGATAWSTEVSSHALSQARVEAQDFDGAIFTNLTRDHLDYHGSMEEYFAAKAHLFSLLGKSTKKNKLAVIHLGASLNTDIIQGTDFATNMQQHARSAGCSVVTFGAREGADIQILHSISSGEGTTIKVKDAGIEHTFFSPLLGEHNVENVVGAYALLTRTVCMAAEFSNAIQKIPQVPGRLERVVADPVQVFVDYAHTPDALERILIALRPLSKNKLWVLFGCGGDRDKGKRPQMLAASQALADGIIVTSDNPRTEDPQSIIDDIVGEDAGSKIIIEIDRKIAIKKALQALAKGDTLVIAGKGHEDYQIIGTTKHHFSDQEEVRKYFFDAKSYVKRVRLRE